MNDLEKIMRELSAMDKDERERLLDKVQRAMNGAQKRELSRMINSGDGDGVGKLINSVGDADIKRRLRDILG